MSPVVGAEGGGFDLEAEDLFFAVHADGDHAAAGFGLDDGGGELLLHLGLHLAGLRHHFFDPAEVGEGHRSCQLDRLQVTG